MSIMIYFFQPWLFSTESMAIQVSRSVQLEGIKVAILTVAVRGMRGSRKCITASGSTLGGERGSWLKWRDQLTSLNGTRKYEYDGSISSGGRLFL